MQPLKPAICVMGYNVAPAKLRTLVCVFCTFVSILLKTVHQGASLVAERSGDWGETPVAQAPPALSVTWPFSCSPAWQEEARGAAAADERLLPCHPAPPPPGASQVPGWTSGVWSWGGRGDVADLQAAVNFEQTQLSAATCASSSRKNDVDENNLCSPPENLNRRRWPHSPRVQTHMCD